MRGEATFQEWGLSGIIASETGTIEENNLLLRGIPRPGDGKRDFTLTGRCKDGTIGETLLQGIYLLYLQLNNGLFNYL